MKGLGDVMLAKVLTVPAQRTPLVVLGIGWAGGDCSFRVFRD